MKAQYKICIVTGLAILLIWILDAAYGSVLFHEWPLFRFFLTGSFLLFGLIIASIMANHHHAEETLKKHLAAIETSMDGISIYNRDGKFIYANQAYASISGYATADEVVGKTCKHF